MFEIGCPDGLGCESSWCYIYCRLVALIVEIKFIFSLKLLRTLHEFQSVMNCRGWFADLLLEISLLTEGSISIYAVC